MFNHFTSNKFQTARVLFYAGSEITTAVQKWYNPKSHNSIKCVSSVSVCFQFIPEGGRRCLWYLL